MESGGGGYARAVEEAVKELRSAAPRVIETAAGATYVPAGVDGDGQAAASGAFRLRSMDAEVEVSFPEGAVTVRGEAATVAVTIVVLHYLSRSVGPLDLLDPVRFQGLPGAGAYTAAFRSHAEVPLLRRFGEDPEAYLRAVRALGGRPVDPEAQDAEAQWEVPFLPHLPLGVRLGLAEDDLPAECVIVFPRRSGYVYHVEDLAVAGEIVSARLLEAAETSAEADPGRLTVLVTLFDPVEAEMVVSKLRSAGIEAVVQPEALSVVYGLTMEGHGRHHVLVRTEEWVEARGALDQDQE